MVSKIKFNIKKINFLIQNNHKLMMPLVICMAIIVIYPFIAFIIQMTKDYDEFKTALKILLGVILIILSSFHSWLFFVALGNYLNVKEGIY